MKNLLVIAMTAIAVFASVAVADAKTPGQPSATLSVDLPSYYDADYAATTYLANVGEVITFTGSGFRDGLNTMIEFDTDGQYPVAISDGAFTIDHAFSTAGRKYVCTITYQGRGQLGPCLWIVVS